MAIDPKHVLRLNMPQWQGGDRPVYRLGGRVLAAIAPEPQGPAETIAVSPSADGVRPVHGGIVSRGALLDQLTAARSAILRHKPEAIVTLGGDCLVDLAPIAYLSERYGDELAVLWVDAHPDVMGPAQFQNAHAHVLAMLMGEGDPDFVAVVSRPLDPRRILYVGLTETTPFETGFIEKHGLAHLSPEELGPEELPASSEPVLAWLRTTGAKWVAVHFDVDVLEPAHYDFLLFRDPSAAPNTYEGVARGRMQLEQVAAILNAVASEADIVGLAIAEYLPWSVIEFANALDTLPLLRGSNQVTRRPPDP
jgi:arginase